MNHQLGFITLDSENVSLSENCFKHVSNFYNSGCKSHKIYPDLDLLVNLQVYYY